MPRRRRHAPGKRTRRGGAKRRRCERRHVLHPAERAVARPRPERGLVRSLADACRHNVRRLRSAGERVATRLARKTARRTPAFPLLLQVYGCAGLCAFGGALGATWMSSELVFHGASAARVMGVAGSAVCAGVLIALWMVRRLSRGSAPAAAGRGPRAAFSPVGRGSVIAAGETGELEFAASLTGSLILAFGLVWLALVGGTVMMEPYRELLVRNFVLAPWPKTMLLWLPAVLGLATAGVAATTATLSLQGWHRLLTGRRSSVTNLWLIMLLGSAAAGAVAVMGSRPAVLVIAALAALFLAGVLAVFRKPVEVQVFESAGHASADDSTRGVPFLLALAAAFGAGAAWLMSLPSGLATAEVFGARCGLLTLAMAGGLLAAHSLRRVRSNVAGLLGLFLVALGFVLPYDYLLSAPGGAATARLVVAGFCAAACITFVARRVGKRAGSVQYALARVGAAVALGLVLAFGLVSGARGGPLGLALPALAALATTGVAGVVAVMDRQLQIPLRLAAMGAVGLWLVVIPLAPAGADGAPGDGQLPTLANGTCSLCEDPNDWTRSGTLRTAHVHIGGRLEPRRDGDIWSIDLGGPRWDVIVIHRPDDDASAAERGRAASRRALGRCASALLRGGRLVIELPNEVLAEAALEFAASVRRADLSRAYLLRSREKAAPAGGPHGEHGPRTRETLVLGDDVPSWLMDRMRSDEIDVSLFRVRGSAEFGPIAVPRASARAARIGEGRDLR